MKTNNTPQFISNLPCGEDYTEGKSQERLAVAIAEHITSSDIKNEEKVSRIIGLKGEWGTGKSNVLKLLDKPSEELQREHEVLKQFKEQYCIFEYDAWGHQEDLQRRSFLETLTTELIAKELLCGETNIKNRKGETETVSWNDKLKYLLSTKREFETETRPKLNDTFILFVIVAILTPICAVVANIDCISKIWWLSILIAFLPLLIASVVLFHLKHKRNLTWRDIFHEFITVYSGKIQNDVVFETISEDEPSVSDFKKWMEDISKHIGESNKKLVVVYDNMDRLPADKVKELWSSIHTFFAEKGFSNIWVIIPFDEKHLSCAFGESEEKEQLTKHFISKTFPVVYRVTPPVITDYQKLFNDLYSKAFGGYEENDKETIYRILRLEKPNATIREIIEFINSLVALKQIWKDEIDLLYCAIFKLKEKEIIDHPIVEDIGGDQHGETRTSVRNVTIEEEILSGYYLGDHIKKIVPNDETLQTNIAALAYGVSKELAEQIPMIKYIESCFENTSNDINKYSLSSKFTVILQDTIKNADDARTDSMIKSLSELNIEQFTENDKIIVKDLWNELAKRKEKQKLTKQDFDDSYKSLLLNVNDKESLVANLCKKLQNFGSEGQNVVFSGANYYNVLKNMQDFVSNNNIGIDIILYLNEIKKDIKIFIDYVQTAKVDYKTFKLSVDNDKLNNYFFDKEIRIDDLSVLEYLKYDPQYNFDTLKQKIETIIPSKELTAENFKPILDAYKLISDEKPLKVQLSPNQRNQIWNVFSNQVDKDEYLEIVAIQLAKGVNIGRNLTDQQTVYVANQMDYYGYYGDMLISSNNQNMNQVLKCMTENQLGQTLSLEKVSPQFFNIKNKINVTEKMLLKQFNDKGDNKAAVTKDNIQSVIPKELYQFTKETQNDLTNHINKTAIMALSLVDENTLFNQLNQLNQPNNYWYKVVDSLIETDFCKPLPENVFNIGVRYLKEIAKAGIIPKDNSVRAKIIAKLDRHKTSASIKDIRDTFCDNTQIKISKNTFLFFAVYFEEQGDLISRADRVVHKIIEPIIDDKECLQRIISNPTYYSELIKKAGDDATATKQKLEKIINGSNVDEKTIEFGKLIGINKVINN